MLRLQGGAGNIDDDRFLTRRRQGDLVRFMLSARQVIDRVPRRSTQHEFEWSQALVIVHAFTAAAVILNEQLQGNFLAHGRILGQDILDRHSALRGGEELRQGSTSLRVTFHIGISKGAVSDMAFLVKAVDDDGLHVENDVIGIVGKSLRFLQQLVCFGGVCAAGIDREVLDMDGHAVAVVRYGIDVRHSNDWRVIDRLDRDSQQIGGRFAVLIRDLDADLELTVVVLCRCVDNGLAVRADDDRACCGVVVSALCVLVNRKHQVVDEVFVAIIVGLEGSCVNVIGDQDEVAVDVFPFERQRQDSFLNAGR